MKWDSRVGSYHLSKENRMRSEETKPLVVLEFLPNEEILATATSWAR
jgi:hypothetical protein